MAVCGTLLICSIYWIALFGGAMRALPAAIILLIVVCESSFAQISASLNHPQCYENVGCPHKDRISQAQARYLSCQNLWLVRNTIFHQRGYCFRTGRGRTEFDNSHCTVKSVSDLKFTAVEKRNIVTLEKIERRKGCR